MWILDVSVVSNNYVNGVADLRIEYQCRALPRERITTREKKRSYGTKANYAARAYASPRPPNGQFVFADCLYLGTLSRPEIAVSSFHLGRKEITREGGREGGRDVDQIRTTLFFVSHDAPRIHSYA